MATDEAERAAWLAEVSDRGLLPASAAAGTDDIEATVRALHEYLTLTPARLLSVALVDAVGDRRTQNQPGTTNEYPNWRVPLSGPDGRLLMLEDVMGSAWAASLADVVRRAPTDPAARPAGHVARSAEASGRARRRGRGRSPRRGPRPGAW